MTIRKLLVLSSLWLFFYCTLNMPNDPKPPKWDIELERIPLFKADTLRLGDELKSDDFMRIGDDSLLVVTREDNKKFYLGDKLKIPAQQKSFSDRIGNFEIKGGQSISHEISFVEIFPDLEPFLGQNTVVPSGDMPNIERATTFEDFLSVHIISGGFQIEVYNHLGFVLGDQIMLEITDEDNGTLIARIDLGRIEHNSTGTYFVNLADKTISSNLKVKIYGSLVGSEGQEVLIPSDAGFTVTVTPHDIIADQARARLPQQTFELAGDVDINSDTLKVRTASVKTGSINLSVNNQFQFPIDVAITIPNIKNSGGNAMHVLLTISANGYFEETIVLDNALLDIDGKDLTFETKLSIYPDPQSYYTMSAGDELTVNIDISDVQLAEVTGDFDIGAEFPDISEEVFKNFPEELENISLYNAILTMDFINSPFDEIALHARMQATKGAETRELVINKSFAKGTQIVLDREGINNDGSSPTFIDILNLLPEEIFIEGDVRVIGQNVSFNNQDSLGVAYSIEVPLAFSLSGASYSDHDSLDMDDDARDKIRQYIHSTSIELTIENALPFSGSLSFMVGTDSMAINQELFTISLPRPTLNGEGHVVQSAVATLNISLTQEKYQLLADAYFYKYNITLDDIDLAQLSANDYIIVRDVYVSGQMLIDPDGMSDDSDGDNTNNE